MHIGTMRFFLCKVIRLYRCDGCIIKPTYEGDRHTDCLLNWKDFSQILKQSELQILMNFKTLNIFKMHVLARFTRELL